MPKPDFLFKPPLVLLTDFGLEGPYVGQMKGILTERAPGHPLLDLTHYVAPQDVREGAFLLEVSWRRFPPGSVFVAVVDPGVGTDRAPIAVYAEGRYFVGPDNGLIPGALPDGVFWRAARLELSSRRPTEISATFHGRDVFAPAGADLARGIPLEALGPNLAALVQLPNRKPVMTPERIAGRVVHIDRFGNLVSDVSRDALHDWRGECDPDRLEFQIRGHTIRGLTLTYGVAPSGSPLALFGSLDHLEIAVANGDAARTLGAARGDTLMVVKTCANGKDERREWREA